MSRPFPLRDVPRMRRVAVPQGVGRSAHLVLTTPHGRGTARTCGPSGSAGLTREPSAPMFRQAGERTSARSTSRYHRDSRACVAGLGRDVFDVQQCEWARNRRGLVSGREDSARPRGSRVLAGPCACGTDRGAVRLARPAPAEHGATVLRQAARRSAAARTRRTRRPTTRSSPAASIHTAISSPSEKRGRTSMAGSPWRSCSAACSAVS